MIQINYRLKIYLDTSVISYLEQDDAYERMLETRQFWNLLVEGKHEVYISDVVIDEIAKCEKTKQIKLMDWLNKINYHLIETNENTVALAGKIIDFGVLRQKSFDDCQHIAAAILAGCDIITSWNFKHIVNVKTIKGIKILTTAEGYKDLMIYPPSVLLEEEEE